jgi:Na+-driven multidrug efflux pump
MSPCCRAGADVAAAHAICFQIGLACSLLVDAVAIAAQTLVGQTIKGQPEQAQGIAHRVLQLSLAMGCCLGVLLLAGGKALSSAFLKDTMVATLAASIFPAVALWQPLNALAFAWDGIVYGAGGFKYAPLSHA